MAVTIMFKLIKLFKNKGKRAMDKSNPIYVPKLVVFKIVGLFKHPHDSKSYLNLYDFLNIEILTF